MYYFELFFFTFINYVPVRIFATLMFRGTSRNMRDVPVVIFSTSANVDFAGQY